VQLLQTIPARAELEYDAISAGTAPVSRAIKVSQSGVREAAIALMTLAFAVPHETIQDDVHRLSPKKDHG